MFDVVDDLFDEQHCSGSKRWITAVWAFSVCAEALRVPPVPDILKARLAGASITTFHRVGPAMAHGGYVTLTVLAAQSSCPQLLPPRFMDKLYYP